MWVVCDEDVVLLLLMTMLILMKMIMKRMKKKETVMESEQAVLSMNLPHFTAPGACLVTSCMIAWKAASLRI